MAKRCPISGELVLYLDCKECDEPCVDNFVDNVDKIKEVEDDNDNN